MMYQNLALIKEDFFFTFFFIHKNLLFWLFYCNKINIPVLYFQNAEIKCAVHRRMEAEGRGGLQGGAPGAREGEESEQDGE